MSWQESAACRGMNPETFFPERGVSPKPAKAVCANCPVVEECLEYAMNEHLTSGVFGGLSEHERKRLRAEWQRVLSCRICGHRFISKRPGVCSPECRAISKKRSHEASRLRRSA